VTDNNEKFKQFGSEIQLVLTTLNAIAEKYKIYDGLSIDLLYGYFHATMMDKCIVFDDPRRVGFDVGDKVYYFHPQRGKHYFTITAFQTVDGNVCAYEGIERPYMAGTPICKVESLHKDEDYELHKGLYYTDI